MKGEGDKCTMDGPRSMGPCLVGMVPCRKITQSTWERLATYRTWVVHAVFGMPPFAKHGRGTESRRTILTETTHLGCPRCIWVCEDVETTCLNRINLVNSFDSKRHVGSASHSPLEQIHWSPACTDGKYAIKRGAQCAQARGRLCVHD